MVKSCCAISCTNWMTKGHCCSTDSLLMTIVIVAGYLLSKGRTGSRRSTATSAVLTLLAVKRAMTRFVLTVFPAFLRMSIVQPSEDERENTSSSVQERSEGKKESFSAGFSCYSLNQPRKCGSASSGRESRWPCWRSSTADGWRSWDTDRDYPCKYGVFGDKVL